MPVISINEQVADLGGVLKPARVYVHNACRSQMAEDLKRHPALDVFESCSVWTERRIASTWTLFG